MTETGDSDSDWFDKDEDELLRSIQTKKDHETIEYISGPSTTDEYLKQQRIHAAAAATASGGHVKNSGRISIVELRKLTKLAPFDVFLVVFTHEYDFLNGQIALNDTQERVVLFTHILAKICELEIPAFHGDLLCAFATNEILLEHFRLLATKLFSRRFQDSWSDAEYVDKLVEDMELLLLQSHKMRILSAKGRQVIRDILTLMERSDSIVAKRSVCLEFRQNLKEALLEGEYPETPEETTLEIYPSLNELISNKGVLASATAKTDFDSVHDYLATQRQLLRNDFILPLCACVCALREESDINPLPEHLKLFDDVQIVLNEQFVNSQRHEYLFLDILGSARSTDLESIKVSLDSMQSSLSKIKVGALLCLSSSRHFEDLILATVSYTSTDCLEDGYIGIEIVRQYNIGNIYNRRLIMFETPAFFEPYHNVYNYLSSCSASDIPMKKYIVFGETDPRPPGYMTEDTVYTYSGKKFRPLKEHPTGEELHLNSSQLVAFETALRQEFSLIQGPPGTGKTHLSVHLIKTLIENARTPIVLITYTNESLDKILIKISAHTDRIVRFGSQTRSPQIAKYNVREFKDESQMNARLKRLYFVISEEFKSCFRKLQEVNCEFDGTDESYESIVKAQQAVHRVRHKLESIRIMFQYYVVREKSIIAMTTTCAAKTNFLFRLLRSPIVIFEEAAEILESHIVACLTPFTQHVIMIGDHQQLQPFTSSYQYSLATGMHISLFERLFQRQSNNLVLMTQYRMHPNIAGLLCPTIYKELYNDVSVTQYPPVRAMTKNLYFLTHTHAETKPEQESSVYNQFEIEQIVQLAQHLIRNGLYAANDIVILSPYANQVDRMRHRLLTFAELKTIHVTTVDSFQGLEAKIILLSLVRSNSAQQIGFLKEPNRICVALSRAKHGMYVVGNLDLLSKCSNIWHQIKEKLKMQNAVGGGFPLEIP